MFKRLSTLFLCLLASVNSYYDYGTCYPDRLHVPHVDFDVRIGGYLQRGGITLFTPLYQGGCNLFFGQGQIGHFAGAWTASLGGGYRLLLGPDLAVGINGFGDYSYSEHTTINWVGGSIGAEMIGSFWEARTNIYIPQTAHTRAKLRTTSESEETVQPGPPERPGVLITQTDRYRLESAYYGFDVEGGAGVCLGPASLWAYFGYFWFDTNGLEILQGPRARLELKVPFQMQWGMPELWVGVEWQRDDIHKSQTSATIHVQVPLFCQRKYNCCPNLCTFKRMGDSVRRQNGLLLDFRTRKDIDSRFFGLWFIEEGASGVGTQLDPTSLSNANANSLAGDVIFALGPENIDIDGELSSAYTLKDEQQLISFDNSSTVTIDYGDNFTYTVTDITGSGRGPMIQTNDANDAIVLGEDNNVEGLELVGGDNVISGTGKNNATIRDNIINSDGANIASKGIDLSGMTGTVTIDNNTIENVDAGGFGISAANGAGEEATYVITSNRVTQGDAGVTGICLDFTDAQTTSTIRSNTITNVNLGIEYSQVGTANDTVTIESNDIINPTAGGMILQSLVDGDLTFAIKSNTLTLPTTSAGITMALASPVGGTATINGAITDMNGIRGGTAQPAINIETDFKEATSTATLAIQDTSFTGQQAQDVGTTHLDLGTLNLTLTDNTDTFEDIGAGTITYDITNSGGGTTCLTMTGNTTGRGKPTTPTADRNIQLTQSAGTLNVTELSSLSANNDGQTVNQTGTITNTDDDCPLPVVP